MRQKNENRSQVTLISNGSKVFGVLHLPTIAQTERVPAVLFCHGFGGNKSGRFRLSVKQAERLAEKGIASLRVDFRGCGDSEGDFNEITVESQLEDAKIGADYLLNHPSIDYTRFGLLGRSLGGCLATYLASSLPHVKALALWAPVFDSTPWIAQYKTTNAPVRFFGEVLSQECITQLTTLSAKESLVSVATMPLFIAHGGQDERLGMYHYEQYLSNRQTIGLVEALFLPQSDHEFSNVDEQSVLLDATSSWFIKNLLN